MIKRGLSFFMLLCIVSIAFPLDWPVSKKEVISTFGSYRGGQFSTGISISGKNRTARAVEKGEVIFSIDNGTVHGRLPSGPGNMVVVQHEDGLKSIYTQLQDRSVKTYESSDYQVRKGALLGKIGDTGWTYGRHLGFSILDSEFNQFVNPLLILPSVLDTVKPVIQNARLQYGDTTILLEEDIQVPAGRYNLIADIYDVSQYALGLTPMAPYSVTVYINGSEMNRYTFEALQEVDKRIVLQQSKNREFSEIYFGERTINAGKYDIIPGNVSIEIIVTDYAGNETSITLNFTCIG